MFTVFLVFLTLLIFATSTGLFILKMLEIKQERELEQLKIQLEAESNKKHSLLIKEKLITFNIFLQEIARDFSLIFPTINWSERISSDDFSDKYKPLWSKVGEVQLIADFYVPSIKDLSQDLEQLTTEYWRYLYKALVTEEGERTSPDCLEVEKYSQLVPSKINDISQKIREIGH